MVVRKNIIDGWEKKKDALRQRIQDEVPDSEVQIKLIVDCEAIWKELVDAKNSNLVLFFAYSNGSVTH